MASRAPSPHAKGTSGVARFSLVLATLGRTDELQRFLESLDAQTHRDFELIVVDQNPDDRLGAVLAPYEDRFSILRVGSEKGASRARNVGLGYAGGVIVAFPDDDCVYPPDLLEKVDRFFAKHRGEDGLSGRSVDWSGENSMGRFGTSPHVVDRLNVWGCSIEYAIFLRRESLEDLRFDERLGVGSGTKWGAGEGTDYLLRLLDQGASLRYDPDVMVVHHSFVPPYDVEAVRKAYAYGRGMGFVLRKNKNPMRLKARWLYRPLGGALLALFGLRFAEARFRWNTFRGRLEGLLW